MQIGTFARTTEQVLKGLESNPDFIELRLDLNHKIEFSAAKSAMSKEGVPCTLHLPSHPEWKPIEIARDIIPFIDLGEMIEATLVTFHSPLSTLFYTDEVIDTFLETFPLAYDAAQEAGMNLAFETLGHYYTELMLLFDQFPKINMVLDIGHGQILSIQNRALGHIESFFDHIVMVNVHDNNACELFQEELKKRPLSELTREELLEFARLCDEHLPIGTGKIDFDPIFSALKQRQYDGRFLMMCADPYVFPNERSKFMNMWLSA